MKIECFRSGSKGNSYLINSRLIIEAGIPLTEFFKKTKYNSNIEAVLISHEHKDHAGYLKQYQKFFKVYASKGTQEALNTKTETIAHKQTIETPSFKITAFNTEHDAVEPLGFIIQEKATGERLLFATDTYYLKYKFKDLDYIMIEANYSLEILKENVKAGRLPEIVKDRIIKSHYSIENVIKYLKAIDLKRVKKIYLIHLSENNSDAALFKNLIEKNFFKECVIC